MKLTAPMLVVESVERSKAFYGEVLGQKVVLDFGENVTFDGGFSIQEDFARIGGFDPAMIVKGSCDFELYFEEPDFDAFLERIAPMDIRYLHPVREYPWGQRAVRLFDPDGHLLEVGEPMEAVILRMLRAGMGVEETAKRSQFPIEFVKHLASTL